MPPAVIEREAIAGVAAATAALSREICALCGGQGDPGPAHRQLADPRCKGCRTVGQQVLPGHRRGPAPRRGRRDPEDAIGDEDLLALMNAGGEPDEGTERWPQTFVGGGSTGLAQGGIGGAGWNHLICAACRELVPTPGEAAARSRRSSGRCRSTPTSGRRARDQPGAAHRPASVARSVQPR